MDVKVDRVGSWKEWKWGCEMKEEKEGRQERKKRKCE